MPTYQGWQELEDFCSSVWTTVNGIYVRCFTGPNGSSLFLPAAGFRWGSEIYGAGSNGLYWSSSLYASAPDDAWHFYFLSGDTGMYYNNRYDGLSVRAVREN